MILRSNTCLAQRLNIPWLTLAYIRQSRLALLSNLLVYSSFPMSLELHLYFPCHTHLPLASLSTHVHLLLAQL